MTEPLDSKITLTYSSKWNDMSSRSGFEWGESIPEESLSMELPYPEELTIHQLLSWYVKFLRHFGFSDKVIRKGLANHLFDEVVTDDELREIGKDCGFVTESDFYDKVEEEAKKKVEAKEEWDRLKKTEGPKLSPAAQAVKDAVLALYGDQKAREMAWPIECDSIAAALQAVADHVVPPDPCGNDCCITQCEQIRQDVLAIAAELRGQDQPSSEEP